MTSWLPVGFQMQQATLIIFNQKSNIPVGGIGTLALHPLHFDSCQCASFTFLKWDTPCLILRGNEGWNNSAFTGHLLGALLQGISTLLTLKKAGHQSQATSLMNMQTMNYSPESLKNGGFHGQKIFQWMGWINIFWNNCSFVSSYQYAGKLMITGTAGLLCRRSGKTRSYLTKIQLNILITGPSFEAGIP